MIDNVSILYRQSLPESFCLRLQEALAEKRVEVFFRADDIGPIDAEFVHMMELFQKYHVPLCLAVVPKWMSEERWQAMARFHKDKDLWCWHQHGYSHKNHEVVGKKNEFGESRSAEVIQRDVQNGKKRLTGILGNTLCPVFTPPWNRCSNATLRLLSGLGFQAVSRSTGVQPQADLPDFKINIDLHTGKERVLHQATRRLLQDWEQGIQNGRLGIMLHHPRMNAHAFSFLEQLLQILRKQKGVTFHTFRDFLGTL